MKGYWDLLKKNILCVSCDLTCPAYPCSYILLLLALSGRSLFPIFSSRNAEHVMKQSAFLLSLNILIFELGQVPENRLGKIPISELPCSFPSFFIMLPASRLSNYVPKFLRSYSLISYVLVARGSIYWGWHGFFLEPVEFVFPVTLSVFSPKTFLRHLGNRGSHECGLAKLGEKDFRLCHDTIVVILPALGCRICGGFWIEMIFW